MITRASKIKPEDIKYAIHEAECLYMGEPVSKEAIMKQAAKFARCDVSDVAKFYNDKVKSEETYNVQSTTRKDAQSSDEGLGYTRFDVTGLFSKRSEVTE